jgi:hypothetical protein
MLTLPHCGALRCAALQASKQASSKQNILALPASNTPPLLGMRFKGAKGQVKSSETAQIRDHQHALC